MVEYVDEIIRAKEAQQMDDERFSIVDIEDFNATHAVGLIVANSNFERAGM